MPQSKIRPKTAVLAFMKDLLEMENIEKESSNLPLDKKIELIFECRCKILPNLNGGAKIVIDCVDLKKFELLINNHA